MKHAFVRNAFFSILGRGLSIILGFVATPYIISKVGINGFGAWALLESILAYFALSDMGIGASFDKHIAEYHVKKEYDKVSSVVSAGLVFYLLLGLVLVLITFFLEEWILSMFVFDKVSMEEISFIYTALVLVICVRMTSMPFWSCVKGLLRYDILNKTKMILQSIHFAGILVFLFLGYGLTGLAVNAVLYAVLDIVLAVALAFRSFPELRISVRNNLGQTFSQLLHYGLAIQLVAIAEIVNGQIDKIFLGMFSSVVFVGMYEIGAKIASVANTLAGVVLPILVPTTSQMHAAGQSDEIKQLYIRGIKLMALVLLPITMIVIFHAESLVRLWMGKDGFELAATAARYLTAGFSIYLIGGVGRLMSRGIGIPIYEMQGGVLMSIINVVLSYFMIRAWGLYGAVIASFIALAIGSMFFIVRFNGKLLVPNYRILKLIMIPALFSVVSVAPTVLFPLPTEIVFLQGMGIRMQSFFYLAAVTMIAVSLYISCVFFAGFTSEYKELRTLLPKKKMANEG